MILSVHEVGEQGAETTWLTELSYLTLPSERIVEQAIEANSYAVNAAALLAAMHQRGLIEAPIRYARSVLACRQTTYGFLPVVSWSQVVTYQIERAYSYEVLEEYGIPLWAMIAIAAAGAVLAGLMLFPNPVRDTIVSAVNTYVVPIVKPVIDAARQLAGSIVAGVSQFAQAIGNMTREAVEQLTSAVSALAESGRRIASIIFGPISVPDLRLAMIAGGAGLAAGAIAGAIAARR